MATATVDGITTRYEVLCDGPPLLMFAPGGFDGTIEKWCTAGVYARAKLIDHLPKTYSRILFDRRDAGQSGGPAARLGWPPSVAPGQGLPDHTRSTIAQ